MSFNIHIWQTMKPQTPMHITRSVSHHIQNCLVSTLICLLFLLLQFLGTGYVALYCSSAARSTSEVVLCRGFRIGTHKVNDQNMPSLAPKVCGVPTNNDRENRQYSQSPEMKNCTANRMHSRFDALPSNCNSLFFFCCACAIWPFRGIFLVSFSYGTCTPQQPK